MTPHRVQLVRVVESELSVEVYATSPAEAERLAKDLTPADSREWTVVNCEVMAKAEEE